MACIEATAPAEHVHTSQSRRTACSTNLLTNAKLPDPAKDGRSVGLSVTSISCSLRTHLILLPRVPFPRAVPILLDSLFRSAYRITSSGRSVSHQSLVLNPTGVNREASLRCSAGRRGSSVLSRVLLVACLYLPGLVLECLCVSLYGSFWLLAGCCFFCFPLSVGHKL